MTGLIKKKNSESNIKIFEADKTMKRIKDINTNDELKPLIDLVGKWRFYIGVKDELTQDEILMNINFIRENFSQLNLVDINEAINLSLNGKLDVDIEHYQNFTPIYISRILLAYQQYKGKVIVGIRKEITKQKNLQHKSISEKEKLILAKNNLNNLFKAKDDDSFYDYGSVAYEFIKNNKLIKFTKKLVNEAMEYGSNQSIDNKQKNAYKDAILDSQNNLKKAKEKQESIIRNYARNYVVKKFLNGFDENSWKNFIENITLDMI